MDFLNLGFLKLTEKQKNYAVAIANIVGFVLVTLVIVQNYYDHGLVYQFSVKDLESVRMYFEAKPMYEQVLLVLFIMLVEVVIGLVPALVIYPIIGMLIGSWLGILLIMTGNIGGNIINYYQGKVVARAFFKDSKNLKLLAKLEDGGWKSLFLLRINPLTSFDAISYLAGAIEMDFRKFVMTTSLALLPIVVISTVIGDEFLGKLKYGLEGLVILTVGYIVYTVTKLRYEKVRKKKLESSSD